MHTSSVGFALGCNLGDRQAQLERAIYALTESFTLQEVRVSRFYETEALLPEGASDAWNLPFMNAVIVAALPSAPEPLAMLAEVKRLERQLGRQQRGHWAPREIDIDILFLDDLCLSTDILTLPHAALAERAFVMLPLAEVAPDWMHPLMLRTARELARPFLENGER